MASTSDIIQNYEGMFADRYTLEDKEYQKYVQRPPYPPPMVEDWLNREPRVPSVPEILQNYERMFAHRFTSEDEEYQKYVQRPADPPPLIEDWRNRSGGNQRYRNRFRDGGRQFRGDRYDQQGGYRSGQWQERGWGNSRQGPPSYSQHGRLPQFRDGDRYDQQGGYRSGQWQERGWGNSRQGPPSYSQHGRLPQYGYSSYSRYGPY